MKQELSPYTGKPMILVAEPDSVEFRGEKFDYIHFAYRCVDTGEQFTTDEIDGANIEQVYNPYRMRHGYPFPSEIAALRAYYGVSAAMMSEIMGFGTNQWRYYESGSMPSESNARSILSIRNKSVFLDFLEAARYKIGERAYAKIKKNVEPLPDYVRPSTPTETSGYVSYSAKKIASAVKYFATELGGVFVTKMNKLLFYADFLKYKREGFGLTGLQYRAIKFGPVPDNYGEVYSRAEGVEMEDFIYEGGTSGQLLVATSKPDMDVFSEAEKEVLSEVCERFRKASAGEISEISHKEKGWMECIGSRQLIPYSYAFDIKES